MWRLSRYEEHDITGDDLSMLYGQDFNNFTAEIFEQADQAIQSRLRKFLRKYGVYVNKARGLRISDALVEAVKEELPWPSDDEDKPEPRRKRPTASKASNIGPAPPQTPTPDPVQPRIERIQQYTPVTGQPRRIQPAEPAVVFESTNPF